MRGVARGGFSKAFSMRVIMGTATSGSAHKKPREFFRSGSMSEFKRK